MTHIYLIDDKASRHEQLVQLTQWLNGQCDGLREYTAICPGEDLAPADAARNSIETEKVWEVVSRADTDSVFLIDLSLTEPLFMVDGSFVAINEQYAMHVLHEKISTGGESWVEEAKKHIASAESDYSTLLGSYSTAIYACAVLKARKIPCIIVSGAVGTELFVPWCNDWGLSTAASHGDGSWRTWGEEIIKLHRHPDPIARQIIDCYASPVTDDPCAWQHDWCSNHLEQGKCIWDVDLSDTENKSIHCRPNGKWSYFQDPPRPVAKNVLLKLIEKLGFEFTVTCDIERVVLPKEPAIVFLLSLRELVVAMGEPRPKEINFGKDLDLHYVSVVFNNANKLNSIKRLLRKEWKVHKISPENGPICEQIPDGGLSEAIFHLCHLRLAHIQGDDDWVSLFRNGSAKWGIWPCITENGITFYW